MKTISFKQYLEIQARWLRLMNFKYHITYLKLAEQFGVDLCNKLRTKYIIK